MNISNITSYNSVPEFEMMYLTPMPRNKVECNVISCRVTTSTLLRSHTKPTEARNLDIVIASPLCWLLYLIKFHLCKLPHS